MKKLFSMILVLIMVMGMAGCGQNGSTDISELKKRDGVMLEIIGTPQETMTDEDFHKYTTVRKVTYSGFAYNPNPVNKEGVGISDEDYLFIYKFCKNTLKNNTFKDYREDVCDGTTYAFVFYDENGERHVLYNGYCYDNKELGEISRRISKYALE